VLVKATPDHFQSPSLGEIRWSGHHEVDDVMHGVNIMLLIPATPHMKHSDIFQ
jgi:hypothetical protein